MDYRLIPRNHHEYVGAREQIDVLISELMDRGYWLEASYKEDSWAVTCGLEPDELPVSVRKLIKGHYGLLGGR